MWCSEQIVSRRIGLISSSLDVVPGHDGREGGDQGGQLAVGAGEEKEDEGRSRLLVGLDLNFQSASAYWQDMGLALVM